METYNTKYGTITLYQNEAYIGGVFKSGEYWDEDSLLKLRSFIDPDKNILEIGGHCGTSTVVYSSYLNEPNKVFVYEPQKNMYNLLVRNILQNNLENKIIATNKGVFCYTGIGRMNNTDLDGGMGNVTKRYNEENHLPCNFGGLALGNNGETIELITIDDMNLENIGFIHCDAQGSENFIFSKGINTITKYRPVILFENNYIYARYLYEQVCNTYPNFVEESVFDIRKYCMENLHYSYCIDNFNGSLDCLLLP